MKKDELLKRIEELEKTIWNSWRENWFQAHSKGLFVPDSIPWPEHTGILAHGFTFNEGGNWLIFCIVWPFREYQKWFLYLAIGHWRIGFKRWSYHSKKAEKCLK